MVWRDAPKANVCFIRTGASGAQASKNINGAPFWSVTKSIENLTAERVRLWRLNATFSKPPLLKTAYSRLVSKTSDRNSNAEATFDFPEPFAPTITVRSFGRNEMFL